MVADALTRQALQLVASVTKTGAPKASMARLRGMVAAGPVAVWIRQGPLVMRQLAEALRASRLREQELEAQIRRLGVEQGPPEGALVPEEPPAEPARKRKYHRVD